MIQTKYICDGCEEEFEYAELLFKLTIRNKGPFDSKKMGGDIDDICEFDLCKSCMGKVRKCIHDL